MTNDKKYKMLEITKLYHETNFPEEENCLGYTIDVWQESINQHFNEYLVNFNYLQKLMINYGTLLNILIFVLLKKTSLIGVNFISL